MELSTKKLFFSMKSSKSNIKSSKRDRISTKSTNMKLVSFNINDYSEKEKEKIILKSSKNSNNYILSQKKNPFTLERAKSSKQKNNYINIQKSMNLKNQNINLFNNKKNEKHYDLIINDINEKEPNNLDNKIQDFEALFQIFKKSNLKSTIIMDNNGNNNLNLEQKKFIKDYFDKKEELENNISQCKIQNIKVQKYNRNNILIKENLNSKTLDNIDEFKPMKSKIFKHKQKIHEKNKSRNKLNKSSKNNVEINLRKFFPDNMDNSEEINDNNISFDKKNKSENNNSLFENCTNRSFDSSFLGSIMADDFFKNL